MKESLILRELAFTLLQQSLGLAVLGSIVLGLVASGEQLGDTWGVESRSCGRTCRCAESSWNSKREASVKKTYQPALRSKIRRSIGVFLQPRGIHTPTRMT